MENPFHPIPSFLAVFLPHQICNGTVNIFLPQPDDYNGFAPRCGLSQYFILLHSYSSFQSSLTCRTHTQQPNTMEVT